MYFFQGFMSDLPCLSRTFVQPKTFLYVTFIAAFVATLVGKQTMILFAW